MDVKSVYVPMGPALVVRVPRQRCVARVIHPACGADVFIPDRVTGYGTTPGLFRLVQDSMLIAPKRIVCRSCGQEVKSVTAIPESP